MGKNIQKEDLHFDLPRYVNITEQEKYNLLLLRSFKNIKWYVETRQRKGGQSFSEEALSWDLNEPTHFYDEKIVCTCPKASMIVLNKDHFKTIVNKITVKEQKKLCQEILNLPQFRDFSMP